MKIIALYSVFNGLELLEKSIQNIEKYVDSIVICYQTISNTGNYDNNIEGFLEKIPCRKIKYITDLKLHTKENERRKHQLLLDYAKSINATHYIFMAVDHFYKASEFQKAKEKAAYFDVTFTKMFTYYKEPTWQLSPPEDYYMPFLCKLYDNTTIINTSNYPVKIDPSIRVSTCSNYLIFKENEIMLHHFSCVRNDFKNKLLNAASSVNWSKEKVQTFINEYDTAKAGNEISYFRGRKIIEVPDYFDLNRGSLP